jgi:AraC-like DNA-binding protein
MSLVSFPPSIVPQPAPGRPELETRLSRAPVPGGEAPEDSGTVRCLSHGFPSPHSRWHFHEEYELHLIVAASGDAYVGDWTGPFQPGHLVLTGPWLPHSWVSASEGPADGAQRHAARRDLVVQFHHAPIEAAARHIRELAEVLPMLQRSRRGIEFFGMSGHVEREWHRLSQARGMQRFAIFVDLLHALAGCTSFRVLSGLPLVQPEDPGELDRINVLVAGIVNGTRRLAAAAELARELDISISRFSRRFRRATGSTYTEFANRVRVNQACRMLMESNSLIKQVCFDAGFNNLANFNRRFIEIKGMTPSDFRRRAGGRFGPGAGAGPAGPGPGTATALPLAFGQAAGGDGVQPAAQTSCTAAAMLRPLGATRQGASSEVRPSRIA